MSDGGEAAGPGPAAPEGRLAADLAAARAELARERDVFARGPVIVFRWRAAPGWPVEYCSRNVAQLGYAPEDFTSGRIPYASVVHPDDLQRVADEVRAHSQAGAARFEQAYRVRTAAGEYRWLDDWTVVVRDAAGAPTHYDGYVVDVTERRRLEADLLQASKLESLGRLAGGVAHDFNNLLTVLQSQLDLAERLAGPGAPAALDGVFLEMRDATRRAAGLTRQLLAIARRQPAAPKVFDLDQALTDLRPLLARLVGPTVDLVVDPGHAGPVRLDPTHLEQVVLNLVANARDAVPSGGRVTVATARAADDPEAPPGGWARLAVTDTGEGLDPAAEAHLFEPFFTTKGARGTGLGLATCYGIVRQAGGRIRARPAAPHGTTFEVDLPPA